MNLALRKALLHTAAWLSVFLIVIPLIANKYLGEYSMVRFDPTVSNDYDCIFVEGHSHVGFKLPWFGQSTPIQYLRIRYTPIGAHQPYGIMFIDPKTFAFEANPGFARKPTQMAGHLGSPTPIRQWMESQAHSALTATHADDAQELYSAIILLAETDLGHFRLPTEKTLSHFKVGFTNHITNVPSWILIFAPLLPIWAGVFVSWKRQRST